MLGLARIQAGLFRFNKHINRNLPSCFSDDECIYSVVKVVGAVSNHGLFRANCLARSLCAWFFLLQFGIESELRIGVNRSNGAFAAHAWIERAGKVLNDQPDIHDFFFAFDTNINYLAAD